VYRALDRKQAGPHATPVAVKVLRNVQHTDPDATQRFRRELRLLAKIQHPSVMPILAQGETGDDRIWYAMPLAQGNLADVIESFVGEPVLTLNLMRQVCAGLQHIHQQGIYHRDLKPANILRFEDGSWVISDFGLAVEAERQTTALTSALAGVGSPWFTAPEQWKNARNVDQRADIFSLGKVLHALIIGATPTSDDVPASPMRPVVQRATTNRPGQRYATAADFLAALELCVAGTRETAGETAQRLRSRVRRADAAPSDLDELASWAMQLDERRDPDMVALGDVLTLISTTSIRYLWRIDDTSFRKIFGFFSSWLRRGKIALLLCDTFADFSRKTVNETNDPTILREATASLVEMGYNHNRWFVRDVVIAILQGTSGTEQALAALEGLRSTDIEALRWALGEFSLRSLPPILRRGAENLLQGLGPRPAFHPAGTTPRHAPRHSGDGNRSG
jgi:serine/threonine protein kinase